MSKDDLKLIGVLGFFLALYPITSMHLIWKFNIQQLILVSAITLLVNSFVLIGVILLFTGGGAVENRSSEMKRYKSLARLKVGKKFLLGTLFLTNQRLVFIPRRFYPLRLTIYLRDIKECNKFTMWRIFGGIRVCDDNEHSLLVSNPKEWLNEINKTLRGLTLPD